MTLDNVWVKDGNATYGAGLFVAGTSNVTIKNSTFSGNIASHGGGAIYIDGANLTIQNSTLSGNTINPGGQAGAAVYIYSGNVSIQNSTISGNSAPAEAGVIYNHRAGYLTIQNSIVANQVNGRDCEGAGNFYENGYNIESGIWCFFTLPSDQQNVSSADLKLQPLASSGAGLTPTIALGSGSVALEKIASGAACGGTYPFDQDQRGKPRPGNKNNPSNNCEIGAWEAQTTDLTLAVALRSLKASFRAGQASGVWPALAAAAGLVGAALWRKKRSSGSG